ncbi:MAG TPA: SBBP repeat-containing protein [Candidatus Acidoferrales bacterium]
MMMVHTRAYGGVARFIVVGTLFAASVAGILARSMKDTPLQLSRNVLARPAGAACVQPRTSAATFAKMYGELPLGFEANLGQTDPQVKFISRGADSTLFLTPTDAVLTLRANQITQRALRMSLEDANTSAEVRGLEPLPGKSNYFIGNDPRNWHTNVPAYSKVNYHGIYPGVDVVYYGSHRSLEYDFVVASGADAGRIRLKIAGADRVSISPNGDLVMKTAGREVQLKRPRIYQRDRDTERQVDGGYFLASADEVGLRLGSYDRNRELIIDPVLQYSTFLGGTTSDTANAIAVDSNGDAFITGRTSSADFPTTSGASQTSLRGATNAFVTELNPTGSALVYSTYLGGTNASGTNGDQGMAIAIDSQGDAYVTGSTDSANFPISNAFQSTLKNPVGDAFVTELNSTGSALLYSTYLGGSGAAGDVGSGIAVDSNNSAYVTGKTTSADFPVQNALQGTLNNATSAGFVTEFSAGGASLVYSTYLGGSGTAGESGAAIAVDSSGDAYVTGATSSADFPTTSGAYQTALKGTGFNAFFTEIKTGGVSFVYSTFLGGSTADGGLGFGIALDPSNNVYLTGLTSAPDFPITAGGAQSTLTGTGGHAFVAKISPGTSGAAGLVYSTFLGGSNNAAVADVGRGIAVDVSGDANVTGTTLSADFPVTLGALQTTLKSAGGNAFVTRLNATGTAFLYSTYLGGSNALGDAGQGIALDPNGAAYVAGRTSSSDFPTTTGVLRPNFTAASGQTNGFVAKLAANAVIGIAPSSIDFGNILLNKSGPAQLVTFTNNSSAPLTLSPAPALSGVNASEFQIASNCGTPAATITLQPGASCTVTVNFTPVSLGAASATLMFSDGDPSSPQVVPLTGNGYLDFTISATTPTALSDGNTTTFTVTVTPVDESTQTVGLSCLGAPAGVTCALAPNTVTLDGADAESSIGTITVASSIKTGAAHGSPSGKFGGEGALIVLAFMTIAGLAMTHRRSLRLSFGAAALVCLLIAGCSSGPPGTPAGAYNLQITGTATPGGQTHFVVVVLTID